MEINISNTYQDLSAKVAAETVLLVQKKPNSVLCFPSGDTPLGLFKELIELKNAGKVDFSKCTIIGLDEWLGMDENDEGSCKYFIYREFFNPLGLSPAQIHFFDAKAINPEAECARIDEVIFKLGGIDLMVLGIGMNGHLGLNEPGISPDLYSHVMDLDAVTKVVGQKYFASETNLTRGISLGLKHIMASKRVVLMANGTRKADIVQLVVEGEITNQVPASLIRKHPNACLYLDAEASDKINNK